MNYRYCSFVHISYPWPEITKKTAISRARVCLDFDLTIFSANTFIYQTWKNDIINNYTSRYRFITEVSFMTVFLFSWSGPLSVTLYSCSPLNVSFFCFFPLKAYFYSFRSCFFNQTLTLHFSTQIIQYFLIESLFHI